MILDLGRGPSGKRRRQWKSFTGSRRAAEARLNELLADVDAGVYIKPTKATLGAFFERWLSDYAAARVRATTLEGYRWRSKRLLAGLGDIRLIDLRPEHIQRYYTSMLTTGELAGGTLVKHHNLLRHALATAVRWQLVPNNVAEHVDPPRRSRKEMRALTAAEVHHLLDSCHTTAWYAVFHTLIWTGLRRSELLGLRWQDVDLLMANLRVTQVLHPGRWKIRLGRAKND